MLEIEIMQIFDNSLHQVTYMDTYNRLSPELD